MGKAAARNARNAALVKRIEKARSIAARASGVSLTKRKGTERSLATRAAEALKGDAFHVNVVQSIPGLLRLAARGREVIEKNKRGLGATLPGTRYVGPGNPMDLGLPLTDGDALAYEHDLAYGRLLDAGISPKRVYTGLTQADDDAIRAARHVLMSHADPTALAVFIGLGLKRGASRMVAQALDTVPEPILKRLDLGAIRKFYPDVVVKST